MSGCDYPMMGLKAGRKLKELAEGDYAVIYITEALAEKLKGEIHRYRSEKLPAIIPIPRWFR
jgi:V/A-type H+-transporting ATPase subunit F